MRAKRIALQIGTPKLEAGFQREQLVLEIPQLLRRHHLDASDFLQLRETRVLGEVGLALVVVGTKRDAFMGGKIGVLVLCLQIAKRMGQQSFEIRVGALLWTSDLSHQIGARCPDHVLPGMGGIQQGLSLPEVGGQRIRLLQQTGQLVDFA